MANVRPQTQPIHSLPPFLCSSVPKSGTHLMHQILNGLPGVSNDITDGSKKFFVHNPPNRFYQDHWVRLQALKPNQFGIGHLHYTPQYVEMLRRLKIKHIFIYRDPRDVLISLTYFIADKWGNHPLHHCFKQMTIKQRALTLIHGTKDGFPNFKDYFGPFYGWLDDPDSLHVSFEEVMGSKPSREATLKKIIYYLRDGQPLPPSQLAGMVAALENQMDPTRSRTFRKGKIGSWRDEFDAEMVSAFQQRWNHFLVKTGYEQNHRWS